jgi:hypothetical protein
MTPRTAARIGNRYPRRGPPHDFDDVLTLTAIDVLDKIQTAGDRQFDRCWVSWIYDWWLCSDDDVTPGAMARILDAVRQRFRLQCQRTNATRKPYRNDACMYDTCPKCGGKKAKRGKVCRECRYQRIV